jgi:hypothetical protein
MKFKHTSAFSRRDAPELCSKDLNLRVELIDRRMDHQRIVDKRGHLNAALLQQASRNISLPLPLASDHASPWWRRCAQRSPV